MKIFKIFYIQIFLIVINYSISHALNNTKIIAKVGNEIITSYELENKIKTTLLLSGEEINQKNINGIKNLSLNSLINLKLKTEEIKRFKFKKNNQTRVDNYLDLISSKLNVSLSELQKTFLINQINFDQHIEQIKTEFLWQNLIYEIYSKKINLNEDQILLELNKTIQNQKLIEEYHLAEIEIKILNNSQTNDIENEIKNYINQFGFEKAANKFSISDSAINGGDIGWVNSTALSEEIYMIAKNLKIGSFSGAKRSTDSMLFLKLINKRKISDIDKLNVDEIKNSIISKQTNDLLSIYSNNHLSQKKNITLIEFK
jgi:peptidyl-prolyl cis-trans isomerase SurA